MSEVDTSEIAYVEEGSIFKLLNYLKDAIKDQRISGGKRTASQMCDRIGSIYSSLLEENSTLLRKENDRLTEILNLQQEIIALKSKPSPFSFSSAPSHSTHTYASKVKGPGKHTVILEPIEFPQSQSTVNKKIAQNELKKIVQDLGSKTIDHVKKFSVKNVTSGRNGKIILELPSQEDAQNEVTVFSEKSDLTNYTPKHSTKKNPRMIVKNIPRTNEKEHLRESLLNQNLDVSELAVKGEVFKIVTIIHKGENKTHVVVEVSPKMRKCIKDHRGLKLGFMLHECEDYIYLLRCNKCCLYGHKSIDCKGVILCPYCSGEHEYMSCTSSRPSCRPCQSKGLTGTGHTSYDINKCPTARKIKDLMQNRIEYSYE